MKVPLSYSSRWNLPGSAEECTPVACDVTSNYKNTFRCYYYSKSLLLLQEVPHLPCCQAGII